MENKEFKEEVKEVVEKMTENNKVKGVEQKKTRIKMTLIRLE